MVQDVLECLEAHKKRVFLDKGSDGAEHTAQTSAEGQTPVHWRSANALVVAQRPVEAAPLHSRIQEAIARRSARHLIGMAREPRSVGQGPGLVHQGSLPLQSVLGRLGQIGQIDGLNVFREELRTGQQSMPVLSRQLMVSTLGRMISLGQIGGFDQPALDAAFSLTRLPGLPEPAVSASERCRSSVWGH